MATARSESQQRRLDANAPGTPSMIESPVGITRLVYKSSKRDAMTENAMFRVVAVACLVMFTEGFVATMVFPYAPFMVKEMRGTDRNLGAATGLVFTAFPVGTVLTTRRWGALSNSIGRRPCLLFSLVMGCINVTAIAFCDNYILLVAFRMFQGLVNCSLPMIRTALREKVAALGADEVSAFAGLQAAFGASALAGPALGGLCYGALRDSLTAWAAPQLVATALYVLSLTAAYLYLDETAVIDDNVTRADSVKSQQESPALLQSTSFRYMLVMVAAHSYFFTGWEVGYPLFAQDRNIGLGWTTQDIGFNFLVGSTGLMLYSLCGYSFVQSNVSLANMWRWSWMPVIVLLPIFPRAVTALSSSPTSARVVNYLVQICISVLIGSQFITLQLMMNKFVAKRSDSSLALPIANGWFVSAQSVARAFSPIFTGSLFSLSHSPAVGDQSLVFDVLSVVAIVFCLLVGILYERENSPKSAAAEALLA